MLLVFFPQKRNYKCLRLLPIIIELALATSKTFEHLNPAKVPRSLRLDCRLNSGSGDTLLCVV